MRTAGEGGGKSSDIEKCAGSQLADSSKYFFPMFGNGNTTLLLHILEEREWKKQERKVTAGSCERSNGNSSGKRGEERKKVSRKQCGQIQQYIKTKKKKEKGRGKEIIKDPAS